MSDPGPDFAHDLEGDEERSPIPALLRDPVGILRRGWRWALAAFVLLAVPAVVLSRSVPLQYEATARLMMTSKSIPDEFVPNTIVAGVSEQFQAIRNRVFSRERFARIIERSGIYSEELETRSLNSIVGSLRNRIQVDQQVVRDQFNRERSLNIQVSLRDTDDEKVAAIVNLITSELIDESIDYRAQQSQVTLTFMQREFERADQALREHQRKLAKFRDRHRGSLPEEQAATMARLERLESQRRSLILQINDARAELSELRSRTAPIGGGPSRIDALREDLARLRALYTDEHPEVIAMINRIEALEKVEAGESDAPVASGGSREQELRTRLEAEIAARKERLEEVDREVTEMEALVAKTSEITEEYQALEREEVILQEAYMEYLRKLKNAQLSRSMELAQQGAQLVRLESAIPPTGPVMPRIVYTAAALVLASGLGLVLAVVHELLNPVVVDGLHLEEVTNLPVLGSIPPVA